LLLRLERGTTVAIYKVLLFVAAAALTGQSAQAAPDPKGDDAVAIFGDLCVNLFSGNPKSEVDPTRFVITKISEQNAREIKPNVKGQLWDVSGAKSGVHMLVHYEPVGMCVVEVAEADEATIRTDFERLVQQTSSSLQSAVQREPDRTNKIEGKDATTSMWRMKGPKGDIMLAVTTYPDAKFMIQHLMTVSYVK
jgi:hypothetical protein